MHRHIDGPRACGFQVGSNTGAWIQSIAEPAHIYDDTLWCPHAAPPAVRFDTSLAKFKERAYGERATSYLWAPLLADALGGERRAFRPEVQRG